MLKKIICFSLLLIICYFPASSNIESFYKPYTPTFGEWVDIYFNATLGSNNNNLIIKIIPNIEEKKFKILIYSHSHLGNTMIKNLLDKWKKIIETKCEFWRAKGYEIYFEDFEFKIEYY